MSQSRYLLIFLGMILAILTPAMADPLVSYTGSLNQPRRNHTAISLNDGSVLVVGGDPFASAMAAISAEVYNPITGTYRFTNSGMKFSHHSHTATLLDNGQALIAGGIDGSGASGNSEVYDPATDNFQVVGAMNFPRSLHSSVKLKDGRVFVIGGYYPSPGNPVFAELYNPVTKLWSIVSQPFPGSAQSLQQSALLPNGDVLVTGGHNLTTSAWSQEVWRYSPATNSWKSMVPMVPPPDAHRIAVLPNGKVLIIISAWQFVSSYRPGPTEVYDPDSGPNGSTVGTGTVDVGTGFAVASLSDGKVLVTGGLFTTYAGYTCFCAGQATTVANVFDPSTSTWTNTTSLKDARAGHTATLLSSGSVLHTGGFSYETGYSFHLLTMVSTSELWSAGASTGTIVVGTNLTATSFTITGPATYSGSGTSFTQTNAPQGTYSIAFGPVPGYVTASPDTQVLLGNGTIRFNGEYVPRPTLIVSTPSLAFRYEERGDAPVPPQRVVISSSGGPLAVSAGTTVPWLSVTPSTGVTPINLAVSIGNNLRPGRRTGTVTLSAPEAINPTILLTVTVDVVAVPVILVHGWCSSSGSFAQMAPLLSDSAITVSRPYDYSLFTGSLFGNDPRLDRTIEQLASDFGTFVRGVARQYEADHVEVVAHSMGGLITRAWMANLSDIPYENQVRRLVTIGTPHYGAAAANWRISIAATNCSLVQADQMRFGSTFVTRMHDAWSSDIISRDNVLFIAGTQAPENNPYECNENEGCDDGVVDISSAVLPNTRTDRVRYIPYRHAGGLSPLVIPTINGVESVAHLGFRLVRQFLLNGTVLAQCCGSDTVDYNPPHLRGVVGKQEGLLLLRFDYPNGAFPTLDFTPTLYGYDHREQENGRNITLWGLGVGPYEVIAKKGGVSPVRMTGVSVNLARPTVVGPVPLK